MNRQDILHILFFVFWTGCGCYVARYDPHWRVVLPAALAGWSALMILLPPYGTHTYLYALTAAVAGLAAWKGRTHEHKA